MKFLKQSIFLVALILITSLSVAQKNFEGKITYKITYSELPEGAEMFASMLPSEMKYYIKAEKTRIEQDGAMTGSQVMIMDSKLKMLYILMDMMGQKIVMKQDLANDPEVPEPTITNTTETKKIAGYMCNKAIVKTEEGDMVIFYTTEIPATHDKFNKIPGFPMEYEIRQQGLVMLLQASTVEKSKLENSLFEIPEGYTEKSMEDLQKMLGE
jgi:GLPGLI family protein